MLVLLEVVAEFYGIAWKKKKGNRSIVFNMNTHVSALLVSFKDRNNGIFPIQMNHKLQHMK